MPKIISERCELVKLCHMNCSGPVFHCTFKITPESSSTTVVAVAIMLATLMSKILRFRWWIWHTGCDIYSVWVTLLVAFVQWYHSLGARKQMPDVEQLLKCFGRRRRNWQRPEPKPEPEGNTPPQPRRHRSFHRFSRHRDEADDGDED